LLFFWDSYLSGSLRCLPAGFLVGMLSPLSGCLAGLLKLLTLLDVWPAGFLALLAGLAGLLGFKGLFGLMGWLFCLAGLGISGWHTGWV
jgi:hypothetical protein